MLSRPMVSVRIPSYNHEKYIRDCISSILNQTYSDFEIVIVDDCSTDRSVDVIRSFHDPRIKLEVLPRNSGMNVAVERCMQLGTGKYVANLSSDDLWEPTKLEKQVAFLEQHPEYDAVFTQVQAVGENGQPLGSAEYVSPFDFTNRSPEQWLWRFFYLGNCLCNPSVMIRREVYEAFGYQDKRLVSLSDFELWVKLSFQHRFWILNEELTLFRIRDNGMNLSAINPGNMRRLMFEYKQILNHYLQIRDPKRLERIFPECRKYGEPEEKTIPYFLGRLATDVPSMSHWLWGCETIYKMMEDPEAVKLLEEKYDFRYRDFLDLTKRVPPCPPESQPATKPKTSMLSVAVQRLKHFLAKLSPRLYFALKKGYYKLFRRA